MFENLQKGVEYKRSGTMFYRNTYFFIRSYVDYNDDAVGCSYVLFYFY